MWFTHQLPTHSSSFNVFMSTTLPSVGRLKGYTPIESRYSISSAESTTVLSHLRRISLDLFLIRLDVSHSSSVMSSMWEAIGVLIGLGLSLSASSVPPQTANL